METLLSGLSMEIVQEFRPEYRCDCSKERIERALISIGAGELTEMIEQDGGAEVNCQFCNRVYRFDAAALTALLAAAKQKTEEHDRTEV